MSEAPENPATSATETRLALTLPVRAEALAQLRTVVRGFTTAAGCHEETASAVELAVNEAVTNTLVHAYGPSGGLLHLTILREDGGVAVRVRDEGRGARAERRDTVETGRGLAMVEALAEQVELRRDARGAELFALFRDR